MGAEFLETNVVPTHWKITVRDVRLSQSPLTLNPSPRAGEGL